MYLYIHLFVSIHLNLLYVQIKSQYFARKKKTTSYMYHLWHFSMHAFTHEFFCNKIYLIRNLIHSHYHSDLFFTNFCWFFLAAGVFVSLNYADWMKKKWIKMIFPIVSKTYVNILRHSPMLCFAGFYFRFQFPRYFIPTYAF